ncbi:MAG TPA: hypothetical protein VFJ30_07975, partial [Phycisphaerae bacterium]|nr:hypothetical protein [Phycisphaerae bacterium]
MHSMISLLPITSVVLLAFLVLLPGLAASAADAPAPFTTFALAELPDGQFERGGWSAPASEGDIRFRQALAGKFAPVRVKAWWKDGRLRPEEGERFVL